MTSESPTNTQATSDEQIVLEGAAPADAFDTIAPQIETAYRENVEPYL